MQTSVQASAKQSGPVPRNSMAQCGQAWPAQQQHTHSRSNHTLHQWCCGCWVANGCCWCIDVRLMLAPAAVLLLLLLLPRGLYSTDVMYLPLNLWVVPTTMAFTACAHMRTAQQAARPGVGQCARQSNWQGCPQQDLPHGLLGHCGSHSTRVVYIAHQPLC